MIVAQSDSWNMLPYSVFDLKGMIRPQQSISATKLEYRFCGDYN